MAAAAFERRWSWAVIVVALAGIAAALVLLSGG
jgi:hypothetical protein